MPQSVDVGSVLGGRYKVTARVLASEEQDLVLNGVDQVLNRSVSILVAAPVNASQVSASAREIATGERYGNVQVLDLGVSDGRTYLVTNTANAADLLDLVIERDAPYVEPFFTDTLGSEIFGMPRSREPETDEDDDYVEREEREPRKPLLSGVHKPKLPRFGRNGAAAGAVAGAGSAAGERDLEFGDAAGEPAEAATGGANVPPAPTARPKQSATAKVTKWEEDEEPREVPVPERGARSASTFPQSAMAAGSYDDDGSDGYGNADEDYDDDDSAKDKPNRKSGRVLIGAVLSLVLVLAVVLALSNLGKMGDMFASDPGEEASTVPSQSASADPNASEAAPEPAPAPEIAGITRVVPGNPQLDSASDGALPQIIDGNPSSYWSSYVYASDTFGGLAPNLALVVDLGAESAVNEVNITQLNGTGGSFSVMLNDTPDLEGATSVAQSGFTGPSTSIPVPKTDGQAASARYVIINFTQLPRLSGVQAAYPWGLRIAEIGVS